MRVSVPDFTQARVLVVGDIMLDRYWRGDTLRISPEAPVPVIHVHGTEDKPGGAANVALNTAVLGAQTGLLGITGADEAADRLALGLANVGVKCFLQRQPGLPTITKLRIISRNQQLIRLDFESEAARVQTDSLDKTFRRILSGYDVVILSDYAKGALNSVQALIRQARSQAKAVLVDPKGRDFSKYQNATVLTPNQAEFEAVVGPCGHESDLVEKGLELIRALNLEALLITRGDKGMTLVREGHSELHLPAHAREVYDVTGAGDTVISVLAAGLAAGLDLEHATALANVAAGIVVGKFGTATVSPTELKVALGEAEEAGRGLMTPEQLATAVATARVRGETIVMTNGCFDILHAGHVAYLRDAKKLGSRLVVAVNDDASVRRLKGAGRPINPLTRRMEVLAGLAAVDWVVPFSEDTPEQIIGSIKPDILVKGGDYQPEEIAGYECVTAAGGKVLALNFEEGVSTTSIIETIQGWGDERGKAAVL